jgi:DNA-binding response OmpR family regulator
VNAPGTAPKILLIDSNVYFSKRLTDALKHEGFDVTASTQSVYALTMLEWNTPAAILCATNLRELDAMKIASILHADAKTAGIPVIAIGNGGEQALLEAFSAGCGDYVDRRQSPADIAAHVRAFLTSRIDGFQPTQMVSAPDTALSGELSHMDLATVIQMLGQASQTGALHVNAGEIDALIFFDGGALVHAECGNLFGDEAVVAIVKNCYGASEGVYKFVYGSTAGKRSVLRGAADLMLDAMREYDEQQQEPTGGQAK